MKYSLSSFYQDFITEKVLKESLRNGKILSKNEIDNLVRDKAIETEGFSRPLLYTVDNMLKDRETSSATKTNEIFEAVESDLTVSVLAVVDQEEKISNMYDSTYSKIEGLQKRISLIKDEVEKVLFESENTDNHEELFYERFKTLDMVNQEITTASVDPNIGEVVLKATEQYPIDISSSVDNITVTAVEDSRITNSADVGDMVISNIVKNNNKVWMHQVSTSEPIASVGVDVVLRTSSLRDEINKILMQPYSVDLRTQVNVELAFSDDGLNWVFPDGEYRKRLTELTSFSFKGAKKEYWRFRFTKLGNDGFFSDSFVYNFGLKSLNFQGKVYDKVTRLDLGYYYSKPVMFKNPAEIANIKVCDEVPTGAMITYSLGPIYDSFLPDIEAGTFDYEGMFYYPLSFQDDKSTTIDFLSSSAAPVLNDIEVDPAITYKNKFDDEHGIDFLFTSNYIKGQTTVLRGALSQNNVLAAGKERTYEGVPFGWKLDGSFYSTYVLIEDEEGVEIDIGQTEMYVNNNLVSGRFLLRKGLNFVVTHKSNWKAIDLTTLPLEADQNIDLLYPYNHKYLIEGISDEIYSVDLTQVVGGKSIREIIDKNGVYSTSRKCWSTKMREVDVSTFDINSKNQLDVFCYKKDNINQERIIVRSNPDIGLINGETFSIITKLHSAEEVRGVVFKAVLETEDNRTSPALTEFLVKIK